VKIANLPIVDHRGQIAYFPAAQVLTAPLSKLQVALCDATLAGDNAPLHVMCVSLGRKVEDAGGDLGNEIHLNNLNQRTRYESISRAAKKPPQATLEEALSFSQPDAH
jgi:hypothetical protein